jgi:hypothetical protein
MFSSFFFYLLLNVKILKYFEIVKFSKSGCQTHLLGENKCFSKICWLLVVQMEVYIMLIKLINYVIYANHAFV